MKFDFLTKKRTYENDYKIHKVDKEIAIGKLVIIMHRKFAMHYKIMANALMLHYRLNLSKLYKLHAHSSKTLQNPEGIPNINIFYLSCYVNDLIPKVAQTITYPSIYIRKKVRKKNLSFIYLSYLLMYSNISLQASNLIYGIGLC